MANSAENLSNDIEDFGWRPDVLKNEDSLEVELEKSRNSGRERSIY